MSETMKIISRCGKCKKSLLKDFFSIGTDEEGNVTQLYHTKCIEPEKNPELEEMVMGDKDCCGLDCSPKCGEGPHNITGCEGNCKTICECKYKKSRVRQETVEYPIVESDESLSDPDQISQRMEDCFDEAKRIMREKVPMARYEMQQRIPNVAVALFNSGWCKE